MIIKQYTEYKNKTEIESKKWEMNHDVWDRDFYWCSNIGSVTFY